MGGEEFAWLMPETDDAAAWQAAERARRPRSAPRRSRGRPGHDLAGVCDLVQAGDAQRLYALADGALYWAKHHGRDVVVRYSPDVVDVLSAEERATRLERAPGPPEHPRPRARRGRQGSLDAPPLGARRRPRRAAWRRAGVVAAAHRPPARGGLVHDVGKIGVPDAILLKPGPLTDGERALVKGHAALGGDIVTDVLDPEQVSWVRSHHEAWDGRRLPGRPGRRRDPGRRPRDRASPTPGTS